MPCARTLRPLAVDFLDRDGLAVAGGELLNDDGVAAVGMHAAGEDARGLAGADFAVKRMPGGDFTDQL